jgi:copper chaperone
MAATTPGSTGQLCFEVGDMTCNHCRDAITAQVAELDGVRAVDVDLAAGLVTVSGEELAEQVVREAIALAGYDARLRTA